LAKKVKSAGPGWSVSFSKKLIKIAVSSTVNNFRGLIFEFILVLSNHRFILFSCNPVKSANFFISFFEA
jgi:hypothetical protein